MKVYEGLIDDPEVTIEGLVDGCFLDESVMTGLGVERSLMNEIGRCVESEAFFHPLAIDPIVLGFHGRKKTWFLCWIVRSLRLIG